VKQLRDCRGARRSAYVSDVDNEELEPAPSHDERDAAIAREPDVLLDVQKLSVEEISLEVEDLRARVSLQADVLQLLKLHVGVEADLGRVDLTIKGVEAKALLKVRLDNVARIVDRVLTTVDNNPDIVERLLEHVGETVEEVGAGAGDAVGEFGEGAGRAVGEIGGAVGEVGRAAGGVVEDVGDVAEEARPRRRTKEAPERRRRRKAESPGTPPAKGSRTSRGRRSEGD
jgi:hypothetical protein